MEIETYDIFEAAELDTLLADRLVIIDNKEGWTLNRRDEFNRLKLQLVIAALKAQVST